MKRFLIIGMLTVSLANGFQFEKGQKNISFTVGAGSGFNTTYTIVGVTASYFVTDGLAVGLEYRGWLGGTPTMHEVGLPVTYYAPPIKSIRPYAGTFMRQTFISDGYSDYQTYGARAGVAMSKGRGYVSLGWVQEWYSNDNGSDDTRGYPEIAAGASF